MEHTKVFVGTKAIDAAMKEFKATQHITIGAYIYHVTNLEYDTWVDDDGYEIDMLIVTYEARKDV